AFVKDRARDTRPFERVLAMLVTPIEPTPQLGWSLLEAWIEGRLAHEQTTLGAALLALRGAAPMGLTLDSPSGLLGLKAIASDTLLGCVEEALLSARSDDEGRYDRLVRGKLAPPPRIGVGLVKSIDRTLRDASLSDDALRQRLAAQLRAYELDDVDVRAWRTGELAGHLALLQPRHVELAAGKEVGRLHADLVGQAIAEMQRALFGEAGCLELSAASQPLGLSLEVTKRRAHAAIGLTEGVCVATDAQQWATPELLQLALFGETGICEGGVHLMLLREHDALVCAAFNPTTSLLLGAQPDAVLSLILEHAWQLACAWGLARVWVPTSPGIHSNRHAMHEALRARRWPSRTIPTVRFSSSPYAYAYDEVWEVPQ
ncbi:MAG: hypothetical protein ABI321_14120, partial [Polyangia bacterium]